jgi:hypothetical protein
MNISQISRDGYSSSPASPIIHPTHIHPGESSRTSLSATYDSAPGSISGPDSQDLQDVLEQFDPLIQLESANTCINPNGNGSKPSEAENDPTSNQPSIPAITPDLTSEKDLRGLQNHPIKDEDVKPFDFQRFLDQLRHKSADPIARYVKSFLNEFNKRTWTTNEQVKIISDFRAFIASKMAVCAPFSTLSDHELTNALEGMEKLIMNRLYTKTFSPEIPPNQRDDTHEEDILRDKVLDEKMRIWHWIEGRHLDLADRFLRNGEAFVKLASDELVKINHYRAPRDKVICVLNCCKVIFGLLRQTNSEESADGFLPILIFVVIKAQPKDLISNVNYIQRFRNQENLNGEAGYYLSSLIGAISFVETLDRLALSISDKEFETNVENSVRSIAELPEPSIAGTISPPRTPDRQTSPELRPPGTPQPIQPLNASTVLYNSAGLLAAPFKSLSKMFEADPASVDNQEPSTEETGKKVSPEESAARQISAEEHEAQRIHQMEFSSVVNTLKQMFPALDKEVIEDVLREKEGRVGAAVDVCLTLAE